MKYNFLPPDYEAPKSISNYTKLEEGENRFRILSAPIFGWEDWENKKPIRFEMDRKPLKPVDAKKPIKHFWSMIVWNYSASKIQILHITQASIRNALEKLARDDDWGSPFLYDIKIYKTGEGVDTEYSVNPAVPKPVSPDILEAFKQNPCNLEALFLNQDPWEMGHVVGATPLASEVIQAKAPSAIMQAADKQIDLFPSLEKLKAELESSSIPFDRLEEWIKLRCQTKNQGVDEVIAMCLDPLLLPNFKKSFAKWLKSDLKEAVSF